MTKEVELPLYTWRFFGAGSVLEPNNNNNNNDDDDDDDDGDDNYTFT